MWIASQEVCNFFHGLTLKCLPYICLKYICANSGEISYKSNVRYNRTIYFCFPPLANNKHLIKTFGGCCKTNILILHQRVKGLMKKKKWIELNPEPTNLVP